MGGKCIFQGTLGSGSFITTAIFVIILAVGPTTLEHIITNSHLINDLPPSLWGGMVVQR